MECRLWGCKSRQGWVPAAPTWQMFLSVPMVAVPGLSFMM